MSGTVDVAGLSLPGLEALPRDEAGLVSVAALVALLERLVPGELVDDGDVLDVAVAYERVVAAAVAAQLGALSELARRPVSEGPVPGGGLARRGPAGSLRREFVADEVGAALGWGLRAAEARVQVAVALAGRLPATAAALSTGRLDYSRATVLVEETAPLERAAVGTVEAAVLARGGRATPSRLRQVARRAVLRVDPAAAHVRSERRREERCVRVHPLGDGVGLVEAFLPVEHAAAVDAVLSATARAWAAVPGERRTMARLRAEALVAPFLQALRTGVLAGADPQSLALHRGRMPGIHLHVHADTLSGSGCPADVEGLGPVTGRLGRHLAAQATTRHLVEHDAARDTEPGYRPSAGLSEHVVDRDGTCVFPGCARPARTGDLDHTVPWPGGPTSAANLGALCRRHHRLKQSPGVALVQPRPGQFRWQLPTGHAHETEPPDP